MLKDAVSIPGISMRYVLNKAIKNNKGKCDLYTPGDPCYCVCSVNCEKPKSGKGKCKKCFTIRKECTKCSKNKAYDLLKTGMVGGQAQVFVRWVEVGKSFIRSNNYKNPKPCKTIRGYDANSLYLSVSGMEMPCGKEKYFEVKNPTDSEYIKKICNDILTDKLFGFCQVDIHTPDNLLEKFEEMPPLYVVDTIPENLIPDHMKEYQKATGRKTIKGALKLLSVTRAKEILLYTPVIKWYLNHGLVITAVHKILEYQPGKPFEWFPSEVSNARRDGDIEVLLEKLSKAFDENKIDDVVTLTNELNQFPDILTFIEEHTENGGTPDDNHRKVLIEKLKPKYKGCKELADTNKLKGNAFYGKMIENKQEHKNTSYTQDEDDVNNAIRSPFFLDMEKIKETYEIIKKKRSVEITTPYQCGIAVYQLSKLRMLEFYYDFIDYYFDRSDFELIYSDTDSYYFAFSDEDLDNLVKPELRNEYFREGKAKFLSTTKYHDRTPGLLGEMTLRVI